MVIYQAESFFPVPGKDPRGPGGRVSVPAPSDPETPDEPYWYDRHAHRCSHYRRVSFTHLLLPPTPKTESGNKATGTGFGLFDHGDIGSKNQMGSVETRFGDVEQLQRCVAIAKRNGLRVLNDMVLHQMAGGRGGFYTYKGARNVANVGKFPKHPGCFRGGVDGKASPPFRPQDPVPAPGDDFPFGDEAVYENSDPPRYMWDGVKEWADWFVRRTDFDGFRIDDTKGLSVKFLRDFLGSGEMRGLWAFNEFFDGNPDTLEWYCRHEMLGRMSMLDFSAHWAIKDVLDYGHGMWRWLPQQAYLGRDPMHSVTFVDSPDTDLSPGQQVINSKRLGYALILLAWEGVPMVYHRDYSTDAGCYGLQPYIDNMVWCHEHLIGGQTAVRHVDNDVIVLERLGFQVGKPGAVIAISKDPWNYRTITCPTALGMNAQLHSYTGQHSDIWTDRNGWATFTVPPNGFGAGNSYLCFSRAGIEDGARAAPRRTTHSFIGEVGDKLDMPALFNGVRGFARVWAEKGTPFGGTLQVNLPDKANLSIIVETSNGAAAASWKSGVRGIEFDGYEVPRDGWLPLAYEASGLPPEGLSYRFDARYMGTQELQ